MPPPVASVQAKQGPRWPQSHDPASTDPDAQPPPEFVHSLLAARRGGWQPFMAIGAGGAAGAAGAAMLQAQATLGNQHVAKAGEQTAPAQDKAGGNPKQDQGQARADKAGTPDAPGATQAPPPPDGATSGDQDPAAAPLKARPGKAGGGGSAALVPAAGTPQAVQQQAAAVAQSLPLPPAPAQAAAAPARRRAAPRKAVRQPVGPPPIPVVKPSYAEVDDPIPEATTRIETAANQKLAEQALPAAEPSPGGHVPDFAARPLTAPERRLLQVDEQALKDAQLPPKEEARLKGIRDRLLAPPAPAPEAGPPLPPAQLKISSEPLPPAQITVAEQELFTGVLARLTADTGKQAREILDTIKGGMKDYPDRALFNTDYPSLRTLGEASLLPGIEDKLKTNVAGVAESIGAAGKTLDDAVAARREELKTHPERSAVALQGEADALVDVSVADTAARLAEAEQAKAVAEDAKEKAKTVAQKPKPGFREMAEAAVARIKDKVSEAIARFKFQEKERLAALDQARTFQLAAYEDAAAADQIVAAKANAPPAGTGTPNPIALLQARKRNSEVINAGRDWVKKMKAALDTLVDGYKAAVQAQTTDWIKAVEDEGAAAYRDLRAWGDAQEGGTESWWQDNAKKLEAWAAATHDTAATWADVESRLARLQLQRDLERVRQSIDLKLAQDNELGADYQTLTEERKKAFVDTVFAARRDAILDGLAAGLASRLLETERARDEKVVDAEILALPNADWPAVNYLAKLGNGNFDAVASGTAIYNAGEGKWARTDEAAIFAKLSGLRPIELAALRKYYENENGAGTLYSHLDSELSGDEWRRAKKLLNGEEGAAAAEAIHDAVWGPGVNDTKIIEVLRGLDPKQREAANQYYKDQYGETLDSRLGGDLEGSKLDEARALLAGRKTEAYAYEMDQALRSRMGGGDREAAAAVYDRIRSEALADAKQQGWTAAECDAEVERRNAELEQVFEDKLGKVGKYHLFSSTQSALQGAFSYAFTGDPTQAKLIRALANNDLPKADAALMQHEREGFYADDDVLNGVVRAQKDRARARVELDRGPAMRQGIDNQLDREEKAAAAAKPDAPPPKTWTTRDRMDRKMALERKMNADLEDLAFDEARRNSAVLDTVLQANHKISLDAMIDQNMSGGDRRQAKDRLRLMRREVGDDPGAKEDRRLDWVYNQVRYSIEGAGTNMDDLRAGLAGLTKAEIEKLDERWRYDHDGETLREAVQGDTSGRDEGDLVDTVDHGAATTVEQRMDEARRRLARDEAATGFLGRWTSGDETKSARLALAEMEKLKADLDNPNLSPERRAQVAAMTNQRIDTANQAIETRRTAVDALADTLTSAFQYVVAAVAIVAGAIATVVTGGGALPILIAILGSVVGTLGSMAIKQAVKGGDYGGEEIFTDLAVGAVDAIVTAVTAGAFKGGSFLKGLGVQLKQFSAASIKISLGQALKRGAAMTLEQRLTEQARRQGTSALGRAARWVGQGAKNLVVDQAHNILPTLPTTLSANLLNERNLRNGNPLRNIAKGTLDQTIEGLKMGVGMAAFGHVVNVGIAHVATVTHPPMSSPMGRHLDFQRWQLDNPGKPHADYAAHVEAQQAREAKHSEQAAAATKEVRRALYDQLPPKERGLIADVPIVHLSEADFTALSRGKGNGDAMIHVHDGQAAIVVRAGVESPAAAVKGLAAELKATVAPGTAGRTVNPHDSLPPHLRNRITIVPSGDPTLLVERVRAVPEFHRDGHMIGVKLEIAPNATAADIRTHVGTIDAMRKLTGLLGEVRLKMLDVGQAIGLDLVSPRQRGRWEAALELAKLPGVIEAYVTRLAEQGLDPRRRARIEQEIANLRSQFEMETARFKQGAAAEARGYVAADPDGRSKQIPEPAEEGAKKTGSETPEKKTPELPEKTPATPEPESDLPQADPKRARINEILEDVRKTEAAGTKADIDKHQDVLTEPLNFARDKGDKYIDALRNKAIKSRLPESLQKKIDKLKYLSDPDLLAALHAQLLQSPEYQQILADGKPVADVNRLKAMGERLDEVLAQRERHAGYDKVMAEAERRLAALRAEFEGLGRVVADVPLHPDLPDPDAGISYKPKEVPKADTPAKKMAHINGFKSELRLGNAIAEHGGDIVVQFANESGIHGADAVSVNKNTGEVTLWDSKYREAGGFFHSSTFEKTTARADAVAGALEFLRNGNHKLSAELKAKAIANLEKDNFLAVTSHTDGGPFTNRCKRYTRNVGTEVSPPW